MSPRFRFPLPKFSDKYRSTRYARTLGQSPRVKVGAAAAAALAVAGVATAVATSATPTASAASDLNAASHAAALHSPAHHQAGNAHAAPAASHHAAATHTPAPAKQAPAKQAPAAVHTSGKAAAHKAKPAAHKAKPAAHKAKPAAHKAKPAAHKAKPAAHKAKPAAHKAKPAAHKAKPAAHKAKPAAHKAKPAAHKAATRHDYLIYDSVTPSSLPRHHEVAIYANGGYAAPRSAAAGLPMLYIDTNGSNPKASVLDVEPGDATPSGAAVWARARLSANPHALARIYTMRSEWAATKAAVDALPASMRSRVRWWIADPTGVPHIVPGSDATQWYWGSGYDISTATPKFG